MFQLIHSVSFGFLVERPLLFPFRICLLLSIAVFCISGKTFRLLLIENTVDWDPELVLREEPLGETYRCSPFVSEHPEESRGY